MDRFMRGMCVAALLWFSWVAFALYYAATHALPNGAPIHLAAADPWCNFTPSDPLISKPRHNYDYRIGVKHKGSTA